MLLELKMVNSPDGDINLLNNLHTLTGLQSSNIVFLFFCCCVFGVVVRFLWGVLGLLFVCFFVVVFLFVNRATMARSK